MQPSRSFLALITAGILLYLLAIENNSFVSLQRSNKGVPSNERSSSPVSQPSANSTELHDVVASHSFLDDIAKHGSLPLLSATHTPLDVVIPFDGELSVKQLELLLGHVKGKEHDAVGLTPQWDEQLRLTLRSLQKHLLCVPRNTSQLEVQTIHILLRSGSSLPAWLKFGYPENGEHSSPDCQQGSLGSVQVRIETVRGGGTFNHFTMEAQIAAIPSLAPHFLYFPTGTVFTGRVVRKDLFEPLVALDHKKRVFFPRATLATETQTSTVTMKRVHNEDGVAQKLLKTQLRYVQALHIGASDLPTLPLLSAVHVVNTYLFTHYASGHAVAKSGTQILQHVSREVQQIVARDSANKVVLASESVSPLVLHDAALIRSLAVGEKVDNRTLRHHTIHCWNGDDATDALITHYATRNSEKQTTPLTLRLMPSLRHPFWIERFFWQREAKTLTDQTKNMTEIMGLSSEGSAPYEFEKSTEIPLAPKKKLLFDKTRTFPEPEDPVTAFPCGPLRTRLESTSLPSAGIVNDLLRAEPPTSPHSVLPAWDAPQSNTSASAATIASMQCWYPGRPLHAFKDEVPEISAIPKLSERVNTAVASMLGSHGDETSASNTIKHHRLATIDMVYTYVKGDAPKWLKQMRAAEGKLGIERDDSRIRDWDELRYSLRSLKRFVCRDGDCCGQESGLAIGAIYIVMATEEHIPAWLTGYKVGAVGLDEEREAMTDEDKRNCRPPLRIITHDMIFPGAGNNPRIGEHTKNPELQAKFLPTFNSHAIESCLHRIPGLRSHFVYLNNDFMFGRNVFVNDFFRPVLHFERPMLEPLVPVEHIVSDLTDLDMGLLETNISALDFDMEAILFKSNPQRYSNCEKRSIRRGVSKSLQADLSSTNQWVRTKFFNSMLIFDRMEGMNINRKHSHLPMLFHRDTMHKMQEVDFADISFHTRTGKFRAEDHLATEFMYIYYASAHRRARGTLNDPSFCAAVGSTDYPHGPIKRLYQRWNHAESYEIDKKWGYHWFYQVSNRNIKTYIEDVKSGERPLTTFVSINDNFGDETDDEEFAGQFKLFSELMNLLVSNAPPSWFEAQTQKS